MITEYLLKIIEPAHKSTKPSPNICPSSLEYHQSISNVSPMLMKYNNGNVGSNGFVCFALQSVRCKIKVVHTKP